MKSTEDKEADRAKEIVSLARKHAPCIHLFIWAMASKRFPGIHPSEVYRAVMHDAQLSFDGKTSIVTLSKTTNKEKA